MHSIHFILENSQEDTLVPLGVKKENSDTAKADHSAWSGAKGGDNVAFSASNEPAQPVRFADLFFKTRYSRRTTIAARRARVAQPRGRKTALP